MKIFSVAIVFISSLISGCSDSDGVLKTGQVIAKVNGDEITVHQVNTEIKRMQVPVVNPQLVAKNVLTSLIDRQLLVQEAIKLNLDRTPEVVQLVDTARAQIYAQAYLARKVSALSIASDSEVSTFINEHPEVFSRRKVFTTEDFIFANDTKKIDFEVLQTLVTNVEQLKEWLKTNQISYEIAEENIPTEAMPKEIMPLIDQIKVGDLLFMHDDIKVVVRSVINISDVPLQPVQAKNMATKAVNERKRQQMILDEVQRLKKLAKIQILDPTLQPPSEASSLNKNATSNSDRSLNGL
ncbi:EpsD family peptidyl-prolyl cis-trans isomerase [Methylophilus sp.]|uniref:EpsD family peptidyl-prolyl cis-trans isomerase n=1 Tax=Methylophilus sp. TaxID=29541 RepID=UPI000D4A130A|nr:EpsD family peptidyl-prolyl cis-trans isomerase [Methylophilus sp.]PPD12394.1 MAG: peptidyl-prolyl cis-trans isomerase, EpsD family [Methylophilus sp.]